MSRSRPTVSASLVLYNSLPSQFEAAIACFLESPIRGRLFVIDNSPEETSFSHRNHPSVVYIHNDSNVGFGAAHNVAIRECVDISEYHLLLNPDVEFSSEVISELMNFLESDLSIGAVMPDIRYPDGSRQHLCKLLPTPFDLIFRRFIPSERLRAKFNERYELNGLRRDRSSDVPNLSGCFLLMRTKILARVGGFDERFFLYMEDVDLVRRIGDIARTVYMPRVWITHGYAKGSYRNPALLRLHIRSALSYFAKWGWWKDPIRRARNRTMLARLARS